eukprot:TRINITY_DN39193_c0_g1_i1.p1 TRINITY_DN39193_c0_g1~~TRINITY_DN39193_c0_g1_i1.p1  ORF type:complete len:380 (-),score=69.72 TRINITY_DN39193_c0_g1_i1:159-1298(-)
MASCEGPMDRRQNLQKQFSEATFPTPAFTAEVAACTRQLHALWTETVANASGSRLPIVLPKYASFGPAFVAGVLLQPPVDAPAPPGLPSLLERRSRGPLSGKAKTGPAEAAAAAAAGLSISDALSIWQTICPPSSEYQLDAAIDEDVLYMLQLSHGRSERWRHASAASAASAVRAERERILLWLFQVSDATGLSDDVLHTAVALLDRLCEALASSSSAAKASGLTSPWEQRTVLAVLCTALKVVGGEDERSKVLRLREYLPFICRSQFTAEDVFRTEQKVLTALGFDVTASTSLDFLDALAVPLAPPGTTAKSSPVPCLGKFLLQLALLEPELQVRYPRSVLAASALLIALKCAYGNSWESQICALLGDTAAICGIETR